MVFHPHLTTGPHLFFSNEKSLEFGGEDYDHCCHSNLIRALAEHGVSEPEKFGEKTQAIGWVEFALLGLV